MFLIAIIAIIMVTVVLRSVQAVDAAPKKVKVTWHANGGKIGKTNTKVTPVKKNAKVGKLLKAPTRTGYTFKGWYTKKTGGKKITSATKINKKVTHYAQWKKKTLTQGKELIGHWYSKTNMGSYQIIRNFYFFADGRFSYFDLSGNVNHVDKFEGKYSVSNGKVYFTDVKAYRTFNQMSNMGKYGVLDIIKWDFEEGPVKKSDMTSEHKLFSDKDGNYLQIATYFSSGGKYTLKDTYTFEKR